MKQEVTMTIRVTTEVDVEPNENWDDTCDYLLDEFVTTKYPFDKFKDNNFYFSSTKGGKHLSYITSKKINWKGKTNE